jgi:hypothetical protein
MARARRNSRIQQESPIENERKKASKRHSAGGEPRRLAPRTKGTRTLADETSQSDWFRESIRQGRCRNRHDEPLVIKEVTPEVLEIAKQAANEAVDACCHLRTTAERIGRDPDEIWWLQFAIINAMNSALFALDYLTGGVRELLVLAHPQSQCFTTAGVSRGTAHDLACGVALEMACCAWNAIVAAEKHSVRIRPSTLITFRQVPIRIYERGVKADTWPLFRQKHVWAVREEVLKFPEVDAESLKSRVRWEHLHSSALLERRAKEGGSGPKSPTERAKVFGSTSELRDVQNAADTLYAQVQVVRQIRKAKEHLSLLLDDYCGLRDDHPLPTKWLSAVETLLAGVDAHSSILRAAIPELIDDRTVAVTCTHVTETTGCGVLLKLADDIVNIYQMWTEPPKLDCDEDTLTAIGKAAIASGIGPIWDPMREFANTMATIQEHAPGWAAEWSRLKVIIEAEICRAAARRSTVGGDCSWRKWPIYSPKQLRNDLGLSHSSIVQQLASGEIRNHRITTKRYHIHPDDVARGLATKAASEKSRARSRG